MRIPTRSAVAAESARSRENVLIVLVLASFALGGLNWLTLKSFPDRLTAYSPPNPRAGGEVEIGGTPDHVAFDFAIGTLQRLYRWDIDGSEDYPQNIYQMQTRLTPECRALFNADVVEKGGGGESGRDQLTDRVRDPISVPGWDLYRPELVERRADGSWKVTVKLVHHERVNDLPVKTRGVMYPIRVVPFDVGEKYNPWRLALDCYDEGEEPLPMDEAEVERLIPEWMTE